MSSQLPRLSRAIAAGKTYPERVLQFGGGAFLRGFADWIIHRLNKSGLFNGSIVVVESTGRNQTSAILKEQDQLYTLLTRGIQDGRTIETHEIISSISRGLHATAQWAEVLKVAGNPDLRVIISNTTEAGITFSPEDRFDDAPPNSFPGKLTRVLYERFRQQRRGCIILPCELIEQNGHALKQCVMQMAEIWNLDGQFVDWLGHENVFANTLVDRIVTGFPKDDAENAFAKLGYRDELLDTAEPYSSWIIEAPKHVTTELPFAQAGLNVVWTDDIKPFRDRKVRILNGAHTMTALAAFLAGKNTVVECMNDDMIRGYMRRGLYEEIIPSLDLPREDLESFAAATLERFANPFIQHQLLSISLNSVSKFWARVLPSIKEYAQRSGQIPPSLSFSLAALICFYRGTQMMEKALIGHRGDQEYLIQDNPEALAVFRSTWSRGLPERELVNHVLSQSQLWGEDLTKIHGLAAKVSDSLQQIVRSGMRQAISKIVNNG